MKKSTHRYNVTPAEVISAKRARLRMGKELLSLAAKAAVCSAGIFLLLTQVFLFTQAKGTDMFPAVTDGDLVIVFRLYDQPQKGDVVVYQADGIQRIGRIGAKEGDVVKMDDSGTMEVNGTTQGGQILYPTYSRDTIQYPYQVAENSLFLLGDFRTECTDSRDFGAVPMDQVLGKVITILRRRGI